ncbi:MAG: hypothetical protein WBW45_17560, partial [Bradyrhizobium sp.]
FGLDLIMLQPVRFCARWEARWSLTSAVNAHGCNEAKPFSFGHGIFAESPRNGWSVAASRLAVATSRISYRALEADR